jgi:hypothetical protein
VPEKSAPPKSVPPAVTSKPSAAAPSAAKGHPVKTAVKAPVPPAKAPAGSEADSFKACDLQNCGQTDWKNSLWNLCKRNLRQTSCGKID